MRGRGGVSLLEMMLSLSLLAFIAALVFPFLLLQKRLWSEQETFREERRTLSAAMGRLTRDLQEAGFHSGGLPVLELEEERITYALSRDGEGPPGAGRSEERLVSVYLSGDDLMYRIRTWDAEAAEWSRGSSHTLASGLSAVRFRGLERGGAPSDGPGDICAVEIVLSGGRSLVFRTLVTLRNGPACRKRG